MKENIKHRDTGPLWGETTGERFHRVTSYRVKYHRDISRVYNITLSGWMSFPRDLIIYVSLEYHACYGWDDTELDAAQQTHDAIMTLLLRQNDVIFS